jgi:hypothetical protein
VVVQQLHSCRMPLLLQLLLLQLVKLQTHGRCAKLRKGQSCFQQPDQVPMALYSRTSQVPLDATVNCAATRFPP